MLAPHPSGSQHAARILACLPHLDPTELSDPASPPHTLVARPAGTVASPQSPPK
jgi:hypothetical protein